MFEKKHFCEYQDKNTKTLYYCTSSCCNEQLPTRSLNGSLAVLLGWQNTGALEHRQIYYKATVFKTKLLFVAIQELGDDLQKLPDDYFQNVMKD